MNYYIGCDLGTSGVKTVVFDICGNVIDSFMEEYDIISLENGYAEQDPNVWLSATIKTLSKISLLDISSDIKGIGLSGQMHGLVLLDKNDNVLRNSIIWCDNRTDKEAVEIKEKIGIDKLKEITGNIPMPAFTLAKLLWVKNNEPNIYSKINKVLLPKDYIAYMLTKEFKAEYSDSSGMQILDIKNLNYSHDILKAFDIPSTWFGSLIRSDEIRGYLTKEVSKKTGLNNIFVCGGAGDQAAGAIGNGIVNETDASIVLGSSGVVYSPIKDLVVSINGEVQTFVIAIYNKYHIMGVTNGCGTSLKWLRDTQYNLEYNKMTELAEKVPCGSNQLYYLPYLMGERTPILDTDAKGVFFGIKNTTSKGEMIRSVMEGVGYSIKDCFELISNDVSRILISGGGAKSPLYCKIIASMIKRPVIQIKQVEGPSLGAAILAMVANHEYNSIEEACMKIIKTNNITYPIDEWSSRYDEGFKIYKEIYDNTKNIFKKMKV